MKRLTFLILVCTIATASFTINSFAGYYGSIQVEQTDSTIKKSSTLSGHKIAKGALLDWSIQPIEEVKEVHVQVSEDGKAFRNLATMQPATSNYNHEWSAGRGEAYYRLEILWKEGNSTFTSSVFISGTVYPLSIALLTNPIANIVKLKVSNNTPQPFAAEWRNSQGSFIETQSFNVSAGVSTVLITPPAQVTPGTYYLRVVSDDKKLRQLFRVVKQ